MESLNMLGYRQWVARKWFAGTCLASTLALSAALGGMASWHHRDSTRAIAQSTPELSANLPPVTVDGLNRFRARIGGASVAVSVVELDASQPDFQMRPFWASPYQVPGLMDTQSAARRAGADIVINGGFFIRITHQPLGAIKVDNSWVSGPILGRGVMAWTDSGDFLFDRVQFYEEAQLSNGETLLISDLNSGYFRAGFSRYTPVWGRSYVTETDNEVAIVVESNRIVDIRIADVAGSLTLSIPNNGYLLVARQTAAVAQARSLQLGTDVIVSTRATPDLLSLYPHAIGAGPLLMKDGAIVLDAEVERFRPPFPTQRAARSAVGLTAERQLLFVTAGKGE
ncbi:MAG: phosphodiester glycosidase family protein, partial [Cyanobacteria bacterium P01_E01_bin.34]